MRFLSTRLSLVLASSALLLGVLHCSSSDEGGSGGPAPSGSVTAPPPGTGSGVIGAKGGSISTADGSVKVDVPPGALSADTAITIAPATGAPPAGSVGALYDIGPTGTLFNVPVKMTFRYANGDLAGHAVSELRAGTVAEGKWQVLASQSIDAVASTVAGTTTHLSPFGVFFSTTGGTCIPRTWDVACVPDGDGGTRCSPTPSCAKPAGAGGANPCDTFPGSLMTSCQDHAGGVQATCCFPIDVPTCVYTSAPCVPSQDGDNCDAPSCDDFCSNKYGDAGITQQSCDRDNDDNATNVVCCAGPSAPVPVPAPPTGGDDDDGGTQQPDAGSGDAGVDSGVEAGAMD